MYVPTWGGLAPATMRFNEALTNGFLIQPSNAWTNAAYLIVAVVMMVLSRREKDRRLLYAFSAVSLLVGVSSFLYHASNAFFFQVFDLSSMYLLSSLLLTLNIARLSGCNGIAVNSLVFGLSFAVSLTLLLVFRGKSGAVIFGAGIILALWLELAIRLRNRKVARYTDLLNALFLFAVAFGFWLLDYNHILFRSEDHFLQGHGLWHIINSICFIFLYLFYRQFPLSASRVKARPRITKAIKRSKA